MKPTITYIKNGIEITHKITCWNKSKIIKEITPEYSSTSNYNSYFSDTNIEFYHLKNIIFPEEKGLKFVLQKNQILILENCTFKCENIAFCGGNIQVVNPQFKNQYIFYMETDSTVQDFSIILSKESKNSFVIYFSIEGEKCSIVGNNQKIGISSTADILSLDNINNLEYLDVVGSELILGKQSNIIIENGNWLEMNVQKIRTNDFSLRTKGGFIIINNHIFNKVDKEDCVTVTAEDISRANIITALKGIKEGLELKINTQEKLYFQASSIEIREKIRQQQLIIQEQQQVLKHLEQELEQKAKKIKPSIKKKLSKKPIKHFYPEEKK